VRSVLALALAVTAGTAVAGNGSPAQVRRALILGAPEERLALRPGGVSAYAPGPVVYALGPAQGADGLPICLAGVCQPRVALPGQTQSFADLRQDLFVTMMARAPLQPVSQLARLIASTNLVLDYRAPRQDPTMAAHGGWGKVMVVLRWKLDADGQRVERVLR
jgi:hypothetical protein